MERGPAAAAPAEVDVAVGAEASFPILSGKPLQKEEKLDSPRGEVLKINKGNVLLRHKSIIEKLVNVVVWFVSMEKEKQNTEKKSGLVE